MRRIGIICEGEVSDAPVLELILEHLFPGDDFEFNIDGVSKRDIFSSPDVLLVNQFNNGAERVLIIWDLLPLGHQMGTPSQWSEKPNRKEQRQMLLKTICESETLPPRLLQQARHLACRYGFVEGDEPHPNDGDDLFKLVCICYTLDGWLLADEGVLEDVASTNSRRAERCRMPRPDRCQKPVSELRRYFSCSPNKWLRYYNKIEHNRVIARAYIERGRVERMRVSESFCRVIDAIAQW
jgi:hypothetical protein